MHVATRRAGWVSSSYDVSWDEGKDALSVERFARVVQTTGLDWEDVSLVLRTGEPLGAAMPQRRPQPQAPVRHVLRRLFCQCGVGEQRP